jgi:hypothetical protein
MSRASTIVQVVFELETGVGRGHVLLQKPHAKSQSPWLNVEFRNVVTVLFVAQEKLPLAIKLLHSPKVYWLSSAQNNMRVSEV